MIQAQPGTLDKSFGADGKIYYSNLHGNCNAIAIQEDGKIVTGGMYDSTGGPGFLIARFNSDGSIDKTFGNNGKVITIKGKRRAENVIALAIQPDNKILACGRFINSSAEGDVSVVRYNTDGSIDESFGEKGFIIADVGKDDLVGDMALQADGKIVVTGKKGVKESEISPAFVLRYLSDGTVDNSFGNNGLVITDFSTLTTISAITLQTDGKILIGGTYGAGVRQFLVIRYNNDGSLDKNFGTEGQAKLQVEQGDMYSLGLNDLTVQPDGKILGAGTAGPLNYHVALVRFTSEGTTDVSFGQKNGYTVLPMDEGYSVARTISATADNKIILTALYYTGSNTGLSAIKYSENGNLDSSFGDNGIAVTGFDSSDMTANIGAGAIQKDGKIIVGGALWPPNDDDFTRIALVRFNNDIILPITYNNFTATQTKQYITLNWKTTAEVNNAYFSVQRSNNATNYSEIAQVKSLGAGAVAHSYIYTDKIPLKGVNYYRLKQVDKDGKYSYSKVVSVGFIKPGTIKLYPNPAKDQLNIEGLNTSNISTIFVLDVAGRTLQKFTTQSTKYQLNIGALAKGAYIIKVKDGNGTATQKFVKE